MVLDDPRSAPHAREDAPWQHDKKKEDLEHIGKPIRKVDARSKVSGLTQFADDLKLPRMLHMKLLRSTAAHARIRHIELQAAKAAPEAAPPQESQIGSFASVGENYTYSAEGRRDPFQPFRIDTTADERKGGGPLEQFELEQLEVVALVWRGDTARALVTDPSGTTYTVRVGSRMGKNEGRVIHIGDNLVLVKETYVDYAGNESTKDVELRIRTSQQGG